VTAARDQVRRAAHGMEPALVPVRWAGQHVEPEHAGGGGGGGGVTAGAGVAGAGAGVGAVFADTSIEVPPLRVVRVAAADGALELPMGLPC
jgi:hypothetical protein